jgi:hypothetical protein
LRKRNGEEEMRREKIPVVLQVEFSNTFASIVEAEVDNLLESLASTLCL